MGSKERQWIERGGLGGLFVVHWTIPRANLLEEFLHTWESTKDGYIQVVICG